MSDGFDLSDLERRMRGAISVLKSDFAGLRTGRASASLLDPVQVEAYGANTPIAQVATIGVPEPRMISVQVWDKSLVGATDKAIRNAGLGLNPVVDGQNLRIPIPPLNEERRQELSKLAGKYAEQTRVKVRNVRRDGMEELKKLEKSGEISKDEQSDYADEVQKLTDELVKSVDQLLKTKEDEIMQV
ncbi:MAG: ribosome recycling factor [Maricaulaceae bacterium]